MFLDGNAISTTYLIQPTRYNNTKTKRARDTLSYDCMVSPITSEHQTKKKTINKTKSPTATTHCQIATSHYYKLLSIGGGLDCRVTTGEHLDVLGPEVTTNPDGRLGS